jgi:hypothetical protein
MLGRGLDVIYRFKMGQHLGLCYRAALDLHEELVNREQNVVLTLLEPMLQTVANLYGKSDDPLVLTGDMMDEGKSIAAGKKTKNYMALGVVYLGKAINAFFLHEFKLASEWAQKSKPPQKVWSNSAPMVFMQLFFEGMGHVVGHRPNIRGAKSCLRELRGHARFAPNVLCTEIFLLEAELASLDGDDNKAQEKFELAIAVAQRKGVIHEQAFACERIALHMNKTGRPDKAAHYLHEAMELFKKWGCDLILQRRYQKQSTCAQ